MKKILLILFITTESFLLADDWQLWTTANLETKINKKIKLAMEAEDRFRNDFKEYFYFHIQPTILFKSKGDNYFGFHMRQAYSKSAPKLWKPETRPAFILTNKIKMGPVSFSSRLRFIYRFLEDKEDRAALRARIGTGLSVKKFLKVFLTDEIFYHYNERGRLDRNRLAVGINSKIKGKKRKDGRRVTVEGKIFYLRQDNKKSIGADWVGTNVLGLGLAGKF